MKASLSTRTFLVLLIFSIIYVGFQAISSQNSYKQAGIPSVEAEVASGRKLLIIRFPASSERQEEIRIYQDNRKVTRIPTDALRYPATIVELSQEDWESLLILREDWCTNDPKFETDKNNKIVYEIGINCGILNKHIEISIYALPKQLDMLIRSVPSPTCKDTFCGFSKSS